MTNNNTIEERHHSLTVPGDMYHLQPEVTAGKAIDMEVLLQQEQHNVKEKVREASCGLKDASNFEDIPNGSKVSSPSATPPKAQDSKGTTISK